MLSKSHITGTRSSMIKMGTGSNRTYIVGATIQDNTLRPGLIWKWTSDRPGYRSGGLLFRITLIYSIVPVALRRSLGRLYCHF